MTDTHKHMPSRVLVTGGAGFIGSNFIMHLLGDPAFEGTVVNLDKLTYAGNLLSLKDMEADHGGRRYFFERGDICDFSLMSAIFEKYDIDTVIHFAAESHVDRSIYGPKDFVETNVTGTLSLLEAARKAWAGRRDVLFHHVSTDEVYGSLGETGYFYETTPYAPRSPYSASKAASDHLVNAYHHTYGLPITISNCSNNYGPYQFPEKLIPLIILNALEGKPLPVYGDGRNVRDWLYVADHCEAVWHIVTRGTPGETYNVGGECERQNIEVVNGICDILDGLGRHPQGVKSCRDLITYVDDRPGHDRRYAINCDKLKNELGWKQRYDFDTALRLTVSWYIDNPGWIGSVQSGEYLKWVEKNYGQR